MEWKESEGKPIPRWKVGPRIWRVNKEWRIRFYRPWSQHRLVEVQSTDFLWCLYFVGIAAGWWKGLEDETPETQGQEDGEDA